MTTPIVTEVPITHGAAHGCPRCGHRTLPPAVMPNGYRMCVRCNAHFRPEDSITTNGNRSR